MFPPNWQLPAKKSNYLKDFCSMVCYHAKGTATFSTLYGNVGKLIQLIN